LVAFTPFCIFTAIVSGTTPDRCQIIIYCGLSGDNVHGSFHKQCTRWQNCGVGDAIPV